MDSNHLKDVKVGDVLVVGALHRSACVTVESVGRDYVYTNRGVYRKADGRQKVGTGNGLARTVLGWRIAMQAEAARASLRAAYIEVGYNVGASDVLRAYHALRREFPLGDLPALETFIVPG